MGSLHWVDPTKLNHNMNSSLVEWERERNECVEKSCNFFSVRIDVNNICIKACVQNKAQHCPSSAFISGYDAFW